MSTSTLESQAPTTVAVATTLNVTDRCDRCNAQAFVVARKGDMSELLFCGHHGRKHMSALVAQGFDIEDQTHRINEKPSVSANSI